MSIDLIQAFWFSSLKPTEKMHSFPRYLDPLSHHQLKKKNVVKIGLPLKKTFWIRACRLILFRPFGSAAISQLRKCTLFQALICHWLGQTYLTLNAPITTQVVCFFRLLKCLSSLCGKQCGPRSDCIGAVCSGTTLHVSILNSSVMLGNFFAADDFSRRYFQMHFSWRFKG